MLHIGYLPTIGYEPKASDARHDARRFDTRVVVFEELIYHRLSRA
jgi:hypothetical protein